MASSTTDIDYKARLDKALQIIEARQLTIQKLQLEILQLKKLVFGSRHEKFIAAGQGAPTLFDVAPIAEVVTTATATVSYEKKTTQLQSSHHGRNSFPENLRREEQVIYPEGIDTTTAKQLGEDVTEVLAYKPCGLFVKKLIRPKLMDVATNRIYPAAAPDRSLERSSVDPSLAAQVIVENLPLYRQLKRYLRLGVTISDSTIGDWVTAASKLLLPLYDAHALLVLSTGYLHADETIIKVLDSDKKGASHQGYYWVYQCHQQKLVLFDYRTGRGREGPQSILENYQGYLQTDGYQVYDEFAKKPGIILLGCMAHARRKFNEALKNNNQAAYAMTEIQKLYAIERYLTDNNIEGEDKLLYRKENALPILNQLKQWMTQAYPTVIPGSAFGKALFYSLQRWDKLSLYATTSLLNPDFAIEKNEAILSSLNKISTAKQLDFSNLND